MPSANHIAYDILNIATSGSTPIDFKIDLNQILYWIDQYRAMLISQALQKKETITDSWIQSISCLDLIEVDKSECCEIETDCKILRTQLSIPETVEARSANTIVRVLKPNGNHISEVNPSEARYTKYTKYGNIGTKWYFKNGYIYIIDDEYLEKITVYGIFDRPSDLADYVSCDGSTCYTPDDEYPCTMKMAKDITGIILKERVYPYLQLPQDTSNDANQQPNQQPNTRGL